MTWSVGEYATYLLIALPVTIWVATTLSRNGRVFLHDVFTSDEVADATNRLLVVGFYLLNLGFVLLWLRSGDGTKNLQDLIEGLSTKIGIVLLALGALHVLNVIAFSKIRRRSHLENQTALAYKDQLSRWATQQHPGQ